MCHGSVLVCCWVVAALVTNSLDEERAGVETEADASFLAARAWAAFLPLAASVYFSCTVAEPGRYSASNFGIEVGYDLVFLAAWRLAYWRWRQGGGVF